MADFSRGHCTNCKRGGMSFDLLIFISPSIVHESCHDIDENIQIVRYTHKTKSETKRQKRKCMAIRKVAFRFE